MMSSGGVLLDMNRSDSQLTIRERDIMDLFVFVTTEILLFRIEYSPNKSVNQRRSQEIKVEWAEIAISTPPSNPIAVK